MVAVPPYGPRDDTALEAYWLKCDGLSYSEVATALSGPPHNCGGKTTAIEWVRRGRVIEARDGGPMRKRRARREMADIAAARLRAQAAADLEAQRWSADRASYYREQRELLRFQMQLLGLQAASAATRAKVDVSGETAVQYPVELLAALAGVPQRKWQPPPDDDDDPDDEEDAS